MRTEESQIQNHGNQTGRVFPVEEYSVETEAMWIEMEEYSVETEVM
jgi:hypothetical protein